MGVWHIHEDTRSNESKSLRMGRKVKRSNNPMRRRIDHGERPGPGADYEIAVAAVEPFIIGVIAQLDNGDLFPVCAAIEPQRSVTARDGDLLLFRQPRHALRLLQSSNPSGNPAGAEINVIDAPIAIFGDEQVIALSVESHVVDPTPDVGELNLPD